MTVTNKITDAINKNTSVRLNLIPFTGGLIPFVYAFFWPAQFGTWLGTIVHAFRAASQI